MKKKLIIPKQLFLFFFEFLLNIIKQKKVHNIYLLELSFKTVNKEIKLQYYDLNVSNQDISVGKYTFLLFGSYYDFSKENNIIA